MKTETMTVVQAIATSTRENRIVTLAGLEDGSELQRLCDGDAIANGLHEYWGVDDDGNAWRVHLTLEWYPRDAGGGNGNGKPLRVENATDLRAVESALIDWLAEGDWGHDDGPDLVTGCWGRARRNDAADGSDDVDASIWVRRSTGEYGAEEVRS